MLVAILGTIFLDIWSLSGPRVSSKSWLSSRRHAHSFRPLLLQCSFDYVLNHIRIDLFPLQSLSLHGMCWASIRKKGAKKRPMRSWPSSCGRAADPLSHRPISRMECLKVSFREAIEIQSKGLEVPDINLQRFWLVEGKCFLAICTRPLSCVWAKASHTARTGRCWWSAAVSWCDTRWKPEGAQMQRIEQEVRQKAKKHSNIQHALIRIARSDIA